MCVVKLDPLSSIALLLSQTIVPTPEFTFGQLVTVGIAPELRRQISLVPKLMRQADLAFYLCEVADTTKHQVLYISTGKIDKAAKVTAAKMEYSFPHTAVAHPMVPPAYNLEVPVWNIEKVLLSGAKSVYATKIIDISTHTDTSNGEIYGVVQIQNSRNDDMWMLLRPFLKGRPDRLQAHKKLLFTFLQQYFARNITNKFFPVFVQSDVAYTTRLEDRVVDKTMYPGLVISFDQNSPKQIGTALFEHNNPKICDFHDCSRVDVVKLAGGESIRLCEYLLKLCDGAKASSNDESMKSSILDGIGVVPDLPRGIPDILCRACLNLSEANG